MLSRGNTVIMLVAFVVLYLGFTVIEIVIIKHSTNRSKSKIYEDYPFFRHGFFYKTFFLGLNGKMPTSAIVLSFLVNIGMILSVPFVIWNLIYPAIVPTRILSILLMSSLVLMCVRQVIFMLIKIRL